MSISRPYRRTCRQFVDGSYTEGGRWMYLLHPKFATDPRHYVRAFLLIQQDILELFSFVEPSDTNLDTYSHRIQQLIMRTCVEIEANFTAIFLENSFPRANDNLNISDYKMINRSHRLSDFQVRVPGWNGSKSRRKPFENWDSNKPLLWYQVYNKAKHNRHDNFHLATLDVLMDAFCGLNILLSAQFMDEDYGPGNKSLALSSNYSYEGSDGMEPSIGDMLRISFPTNWPIEDRYDFDWQDISKLDDPFVNYNYEQA